MNNLISKNIDIKVSVAKPMLIRGGSVLLPRVCHKSQLFPGAGLMYIQRGIVFNSSDSTFM